jgi:hypothetical protein
VASRIPFVIDSPRCAAAADVAQLARRVISSGGSLKTSQSYFDRFQHGRKSPSA